MAKIENHNPNDEYCPCFDCKDFRTRGALSRAKLKEAEANAEKLATFLGNTLSVLEELSALDWGEDGPPCNWDELAETATEFLENYYGHEDCCYHCKPEGCSFDCDCQVKEKL